MEATNYELLSGLAVAINNGNKCNAKERVKVAIDRGICVDTIIMEGVARGVAKVSKRYKKFEIGLNEVLMAVEAIETVFEVLEPMLKKDRIRTRGRVVIGVIEGDIHDIGKNIVATLLKASGFEVIDLGRDVPIEKFIYEAMHQKANIIAVSTMMTTTLPNIQKLIETLKKRDLRGRFKVLVGGRAVTKMFADRIDANGYGENGYEALNKAKELLADKK